MRDQAHRNHSVPVLILLDARQHPIVRQADGRDPPPVEIPIITRFLAVGPQVPSRSRLNQRVGTNQPFVSLWVVHRAIHQLHAEPQTHRTMKPRKRCGENGRGIELRALKRDAGGNRIQGSSSSDKPLVLAKHAARQCRLKVRRTHIAFAACLCLTGVRVFSSEAGNVPAGQRFMDVEQVE